MSFLHVRACGGCGGPPGVGPACRVCRCRCCCCCLVRCCPLVVVLVGVRFGTGAQRTFCSPRQALAFAASFLGHRGLRRRECCPSHRHVRRAAGVLSLLSSRAEERIGRRPAHVPIVRGGASCSVARDDSPEMAPERWAQQPNPGGLLSPSPTQHWGSDCGDPSCGISEQRQGE